MDIEKQVGPLIRADFLSQNMHRLHEWFLRFPKAMDILEEELKSPPILYAIRKSMWLSLAFLLAQSYAPRKHLQVLEGQRSEDDLCGSFLRAHVQTLDSEKISVLRHLQERVRL